MTLAFIRTLITNTRKAAGELGRRLAQLGVRGRIPTGTFHAIAYAQLRQWWADTDQRAPELVQSKVRVLAPLLGRYRGGSVGAGGRGSAVQPVDVASEIDWAKARPGNSWDTDTMYMSTWRG